MDKYKFTIPKSILILLILSFVLSIFRVVLFSKFSLVYIFWNIYLAFIPFVISSILLRNFNKHELSKGALIVGGIFWLFLIPNAPYVITDLIHIGEIHAVPIIYDTFLIFSSALVSLILGMYSISHMEQILKIKYSTKIASIFVIIIIFFSSFGMYLGRFLRFNSWDILSRPMKFINGVGEIFTNKPDSIEAIFYTILFFFFISMSYYSWKSTQIK